MVEHNFHVVYIESLYPVKFAQLLKIAILYRNSLPETFYEKFVLRNFANFTGKHVSFFNNVAGLRQAKQNEIGTSKKRRPSLNEKSIRFAMITIMKNSRFHLGSSAKIIKYLYLI